MKINSFFDLCSGIGGGRLGLEQAGLKSVGFCDTSKLSVRTYNLMHHAEDEPYFYNLKNIKSEKLPYFDMLIAGFPCQTFSVIGRKDGFSDDRGQIIFHIARILEETHPVCFLLENVKGLVTHDKGRTIKIILNRLNEAGYDVTYKVLTSLDYGVPQMRQRVYFIGFHKSLKTDIDTFPWPIPQEVPPLKNYLIDNNVASPERLEILQYYLNNPTNEGKYTVEDIKKMEGKIIDTRMNDLRIYDGKCPTLRSQRDGVLYVKNYNIYQLTGYEALLLQGFPKEYADRVVNKVSDRHLLMQAGNAMTVNVISALGTAIINFIKEKEDKRIMSNWEEFELESTDYLNEHYGKYAKFTHKGGSDSTIPDIFVETKTGHSFYMDAKLSPAQCGQFVLLPNVETRTFEYSPLNATPLNRYAEEIIAYMNQFFDDFRVADTAGKDINMPNGNSIFSNWVIDIYSSKGARLFITNNFTIFPIENFSDYFNISAKYRIKKSGSSDVGKTRLTKVADYVSNAGWSVNNLRTAGGKLFANSSNHLNKQTFVLDGCEYMFAQRGNEYEIRKLSNTKNANVIFSITLKGNITGISDSEFKNYLQ